MDRSRILGLLAVLSACSFEFKSPPVPDGYPKLGEFEEGKAELVIDGENYLTESDGGTYYNVEGGYDDDLRASTSFDYDLYLTYRDVEVGTYTIEGGDLTASYRFHHADAACGDGHVEIVGRRHYDAGFGEEGEFVWGTIQLELCRDEYGDGPAVLEVSGRFSSIVTRL
jgi:hypothetical protein